MRKQNNPAYDRLRAINFYQPMSKAHPRWVEFREALERLSRKEGLTPEDRLYLTGRSGKFRQLVHTW